MTRKEAIEKILKYFEEHNEEFANVIEEMDARDGFLDEDMWIPMDRLDEWLEGSTPRQIIVEAVCGYNRDHPDRPFNVTANYFRFNAFGFLVSSDVRDYENYLDEHFAEECIDDWFMLASMPFEVTEIISSIEE